MKHAGILKMGILALAGVLIVVLPLLDMPSYTALFIGVAFYAIGALCFRATLIVGRFSMGQSFFVAVGAYTSAIVCVKAGLDPWLGMLVAGVMSAIAGYLLGLVILRVPGMYFAIITMALTTVSIQIINLFPGLTGGVAGMGKIPAYTIGSYNFAIKLMPYYYLIFAILAVVFVILYRLEKSPAGLLARAIGQNDELTQQMGVNIAQQRLVIFTLTGAMLGVSGAFWAHYLHYLNPGQVGLELAILYQIYALVGGIGNLWGPVLGVAVLELLSDWLRIATLTKPILYGGILVIVFMMLPRGLMSLPEWVRNLRKRRAAKAVAGTTTGIAQN